MFNINEFKSIINLYGGPAKTSLFVVEFGPINSGYISAGDLRFFCNSVDLPGFNLDLVPYKPQGFGMTEHIPVGFSPDQLNCIFMLDSDHNVVSFFHEWMQKIVNYDTTSGVFSEVNGALPFEQGYKKDYTTTMTVKHFSTEDPSFFYEYKFTDVYPALISGKSLSWADSEPYATMRINFSYSGFSVNAAVSGNTTSEGGRNASYLDQLNSVGFYGYKTSKQAQNIQEAIDLFTNTKKK